MIWGMPAQSFFAFLSWPVIYITLSVIVYFIMKKQDDQVDDTEFQQSVKGRNASSAKTEHAEGGAAK